MTFRPGPALTLATVAALAILIALGTWQARKIAPKAALIASIETGLAASPRALALGGVPRAYQRVTAAGHLMPAEPVRVFGTNLAGAPGYHLYLPFLPAGQPAIMLSLGWIPFDHRAPLDLPFDMPISLTGLWLPSATPGLLTPANDRAANVWHLADVAEMAIHFGLTEVQPMRLIADPWRAAALPLGGQVRIDIPNRHREYMLTWYGLAAALLAVYAAYGLARGRAVR